MPYVAAMGVRLAPDSKARRIAAGLTLTAAAAMLGISHGHLANAEAGRRGLSPAVAQRWHALIGGRAHAARQAA